MIRPKAGFSAVSWNEVRGEGERGEARRRGAHAAAGDENIFCKEGIDYVPMRYFNYECQ